MQKAWNRKMRSRPAAARSLFWALYVVALLLAAVPAGAQDGAPVKLADFKGPVTPVLAEYIDSAITQAEEQGAAAVVIELDTPGGSVDITKQITQRMTTAGVPVIVYVAPRGAHAGSAGTFITLAGHKAAMAPGSSIGAASPIDIQGTDLNETGKAKAMNILSADIKNLASRRGPKAVDWAEKAVREAAALTADEALELGVIDAIAVDVPDLLRQLDGQKVTVAGSEVNLELSGAPVEEVPLSPFENFLNTIVNPAIAAILLTLGLNALLFELSSPGGYLAGIIGVACLILAFYALGVLNVNWAGLGFVVLAFILFVLDIKAPTHGALTVGGVLSFVLGAFMLFDTSGLPVPWGAIIGSAVASAAFFGFVMSQALRAQRRPPTTGMEGMLGQVGVVKKAFEPVGTVLVLGELWQADIDPECTVAVGDKVIVTGREGFRLHVRPA